MRGTPFSMYGLNSARSTAARCCVEARVAARALHVDLRRATCLVDQHA
jgi:hypothetical protein